MFSKNMFSRSKLINSHSKLINSHSKLINSHNVANITSLLIGWTVTDRTCYMRNLVCNLQNVASGCKICCRLFQNVSRCCKICCKLLQNMLQVVAKYVANCCKICCRLLQKVEAISTFSATLQVSH